MLHNDRALDIAPPIAWTAKINEIMAHEHIYMVAVILLNSGADTDSAPPNTARISTPIHTYLNKPNIHYCY